MKKETYKKILISFSALAALIIFFAGCQKKTEPQKSQGAAAQVTASAEQTNCPVMGGPINKKFFTEYKGKKVYFCCPDCKPEFEKNPEKYIDKLPQFQN